MSEDSLDIVLQIKTHKSLSDRAKVQIKSDKITPLTEYFQSWSNLMLFYPT